MNKRKFIIRALLIVLFLFSVFLLLKYSKFSIEELTPENIRSFAHDNIVIILIVMFFIMFLQNLLNFFPIILVITANAALFGLWKGFLFSLTCSVIASTIIFLVIRYIFCDIKAPSNYKKYAEKIEKHGFWFVLVARLVPIFPTNIINITSGLSSIKPRHYIIATLLGHALYSLLISSASISIF